MAKIKTQEQVEQEVQELCNGEYKLISVYVNTKSPIIIKHKCGNEINVLAKSFLNEGKGKCQICYPIKTNIIRTKMTFEIFEERFLKNYDRRYSIVNREEKLKSFKYDDLEKTTIIKHLDCGNEININPKNWSRARKLSCKYCANKRRGEHLRSVISDTYLEDITKGTKYKFLEEYQNDNKIKHKILHEECNREYEVRPNDFQQNYRCPHCAQERKESLACIEITEKLMEMNINFNKETTFPGCVYKGQLFFDFTIPLEDEKLLHIEYDGEQHYIKQSGSWNNLETIQARDEAKNKFCENNNNIHNLRRIRYDENHIEKLEEILKEFNII